MKPQSSPLLDFALHDCIKNHPGLSPNAVSIVEKMLTDLIEGKISTETCIGGLMPLIGFSKIPMKISQILRIDQVPKPELNVLDTAERRKKRPKLWVQYEDMRLLAAIHRFGLSKWGPVAMFVGNGRTRSQCSQRWYRSLDPSLNKNKWSDEEDRILLKAVKKHGTTAWTKIAKEVGTRCDVQCRYRYLQVTKNAGASTVNTSAETKNDSVFYIDESEIDLLPNTTLIVSSPQKSTDLWANLGIDC